MIDPDNKQGNYTVALNNGTLAIAAAALTVTAAAGDVSAQRNATSAENTLVPPHAAPLSIPDILLETNRNLDPKAFSFLNATRSKMIRAELDDKTRTMDLTERRNLEVIYAKELLNAGKSDEALQAYRANMNELKTNAPDLFHSMESGGLQFEAICNLPGAADDGAKGEALSQ